MGDTTTLSVKRETLERFNERKAETGDGDVPELSADQFLKSLLDAWDENDQSIYSGVGDLRAFGGEVPTIEVNDIHSEEDAEDLAREVARQVDYAELATQVADELEVRLG